MKPLFLEFVVPVAIGYMFMFAIVTLFKAKVFHMFAFAIAALFKAQVCRKEVVKPNGLVRAGKYVLGALGLSAAFLLCTYYMFTTLEDVWIFRYEIVSLPVFFNIVSIALSGVLLVGLFVLMGVLLKERELA